MKDSNKNKNSNTSINKHTHEHDNTNTNTLKKQGGYTLVELSLVLIVILLLGGAIFASFTALYNSAKDQQIEEEMLQFNLALQRCIGRDDTTLDTCTEDKIILYSGLTSTKTACGDVWIYTRGVNSVEFKYSLDSCEDKDGPGGLGESLALKVNAMPNTTAVYTSPELIITGTR